MSTGTSKFSNVVFALVCIPPVSVGVFAVLLVLDVPPLVAWFWPPSTVNIVEAASLGDAARVRLLAARGESLDAPQPVRPAFLDGQAPSTMSPLEAAVWSRHEDSLVPVLLDLGVHPPPHEAERLYCLAEHLHATDAATLLRDAFHLSLTSCDTSALADRTRG